MPLPHLDRLFDYLVPESMADAAVPGCRIRVRFAGRLTSGYLVERAEVSGHQGTLAFLGRVISPEPVLSGEMAWLARAVADRYGGTMADVLRLAIPPRHGAVEAAGGAGGSSPRVGTAGGAGGSSPRVGTAGGAGGSSLGAGTAAGSGGSASGPPAGRVPPAAASWDRYPAGPSFLAALADGRAPRAIWSALPGSCWPDEIATAVAAAAAAGRGALVVVPDGRDLDRVSAAISVLLPPAEHVSLSAGLGPAERYRRWLAIARGQVKVVAGTRSAMFAPVADLGLVVIWDDGDDLHAEPRAPYPHARDVLLLRAHRDGAAALVGGFAMTAEAAQLLATRWARPLAAERGTVRAHAPLIRTAADDAELARDEAARTARMPSLALRTARSALADGPVLFQVPRRGYLAAVGCQRCGRRVRCPDCAGPVALPGAGRPLCCGWCGSVVRQACTTCPNAGIRALITGARRTAEELSRAFPGVAVRTSTGAGVLATVPAEPAIVIATPGAEPLASGGYAAAILLDGWALLGRASLVAGQEALRRWMNAAALVRSAPEGGRVIVLADPAPAAVQALLRWDAATHAERDLAERAELRFPPTMRIAALTCPADATADLLAHVELPCGADVLGPVPVSPDSADPAQQRVRFLVRAPAQAGTALALALRAGLAERSARKDPGFVRLQLDPAELI